MSVPSSIENEDIFIQSKKAAISPTAKDAKAVAHSGSFSIALRLRARMCPKKRHAARVAAAIAAPVRHLSRRRAPAKCPSHPQCRRVQFPQNCLEQ